MAVHTPDAMSRQWAPAGSQTRPGAEASHVAVWRRSRRLGLSAAPLGAVTADGAQFMNQALARELGVSRWMFRVLADEQRAEARHSEQRLRGRRPAPHLAGRTVILVDDGLATGATMRAAIRSVRQAGPARLVVAVPVAAQPTSEAPRPETRPLPD